MKKIEMFANELNLMLEQSYGEAKAGFFPDVIEKSGTLYKGTRYTNEFKGVGLCISNREFYVVCFNVLGDDKLALQYFESTHKGKGVGSNIMDMITTTAKKNGVTISLDAIPCGDDITSVNWAFRSKNTRQQEEVWNQATDRLIKFYERFGFQSVHRKQPFRMKYLAS